jgi:hypothetical protein
MRALHTLTLACLAAAGCMPADEPTEIEPAATTEPAPAAAAAVDWIEVPLPEGTFAEYADGYRSDVIDIALEPFDELEYKLDLREGQAIVYHWEALELPDPQLLYAEFHGHTERVGGAPGTLMYYRKATGGTESGTLVAPFTGIHGWYLKSSHDQPLVVRLTVAGFYELVGR